MGWPLAFLLEGGAFPPCFPFKGLYCYHGRACLVAYLNGKFLSVSITSYICGYQPFSGLRLVSDDNGCSM